MRLSGAVLGAARLYPAAFRLIVECIARGWLPGADHWLFPILAETVSEHGVWCQIPDDVGLYVAPSARVYYLGFEPLERELWASLLKPGLRVVDLGANAGYYTMVSATAVGDSGHVYAIEPTPANLTLLRHNTRGLRNVSIHTCAAGSSRRRATFLVTRDTLNNAFAAGPYSPVVNTIEVEVRPLDDVIEPPVDLIKMDIQGSEIDALRGMRRLIEQSPDVKLLCEWCPACLRAAGHTAADLPRELESLGLTRLRVVDDHVPQEGSIEEMLHLFEHDPTGRRYVNLLAQRG
jgi:FkbM family methyltransferase